MLGRRIGLGLTLAALALGGSDAVAAAPEGPRLALTQMGPSFLGSKLITVGPTGADRKILTGGTIERPPYPIGRAAWSPNGSRLVIAAMTSLLATRTGPPMQLFELTANGGKPRPLKGTMGGSYPVFAPDGRTVAFAKDKYVVKFRDGFRFHSLSSIWLLDIDTGKSRRLTPWRKNTSQEPSSFLPDGSLLAATRDIEGKRPQAIAVDLDDGKSSVLLPGSASDPVFSPDGTRIAFLRGPAQKFGKNQDLYTARPGGGELRRLTKTPRLNEALPSWDPSGQRLAYGANGVISSLDELFGVGGGIWAINADGTCATDVLEYDGAFLAAPAWQPGPGREAGPLSC